jgi:mycothiol synthase
MDTVPRIYRDRSDLQKMCALLQAGCSDRTTNAYYPHLGDLNWWLFNWLDGQNPWQSIYLWDDPDDRDRLLGWGIYFPWSDFNVFIQPQLCGTDWAMEINTWMEDKSTELARQQGHTYLQRTNVAETDKCMCEHLCQRGFQHVPTDLLALRCSLEDEIPSPVLLEGYTLRPVEQVDVDSRAAAQHAAMQSDAPWQVYRQKYRHFVASPGYSKGRDWTVIAPDGRVAAFCLVWPDDISQVGQIEPVGTHPDFQRKGLGKAVMYAGMRYLRNQGMRTARICTLADNLAAIRLYESVGFREVNKLYLHEKAL